MNATRTAFRPTPRTASCLKPVSAALAGVGFVAALLSPVPFAIAAEVTPTVFAREIDRSPWLLAQAGPGLNDPAAISARSLLAQEKATTVLTVTNTLDDGNPGSLRYAINWANAYGCSVDDFTIQFAIPGAGPHTIATNIGYTINCPATVIDGYSQPGSSPNGIADARNGSNAVPMIVIDGSGMTGGNLFSLLTTANNSRISGLVLKNWPGTFAAIQTGAQLVISGNFIGVDESGMACATKPSAVGVIAGGPAGVVGGSAAADRNIIGCASGTGGVVVTMLGNFVRGNLIGVGKDGMSPLGNQSGILVNNTFNTTIGGQAAGEGNVIAHNSDYGVNYGISSSTVISGNDIFLNGLTGIDTTNPGYNPPNLTIGGVTFGVTGTTITGTTEVFANFTTGLEFFDNDFALVGLDLGEGARFAGVASASTAGSATPFSVTIPGVVRNPTATAQKSGATTVFSAPFLTPDMTPSTTAVSFPATELGNSSSSFALTITNNGQGPLTVDSITHSLPSDFFDTTGGQPPSTTHYCGAGSIASGAPQALPSATLAPGASCTMNLAFRPQASGTRSATLTFNDDNSPNYSVPVTLTGTGGTLTPLPVSVTFTPTSLALPGPVPAFSTLNFKVDNPNLAPATGLVLAHTLPANLVIAPTPNASVTGASCGGAFISATPGASSFTVDTLAVPTSGSCDLKIDVTSSLPGTYSTTVAAGAMTGGTVLSQAVSNALSNTASLALNAAALMLSPPSPLDFGTVSLGSSAPVPVTLTNTGGVALDFSAPFAVAGANAADFSFTDTCVPDPLAQLAPGASCVVTVTFTPQATGVRSASMSFASNTLTTPDVLNLAGTGSPTPVPVVSLSPTGLTFPPQTVGTTSSPQVATLSNIGTAPLNISSIATLGDFAQSSTCGTSLAQAASCTISVTFTPIIAGLRTGEVKVFDDASGSPHLVALDGSGVAPPVPTLTAPATVSFPTVQVGGSSSAIDITIGNSGGAPLAVSLIEVVGAGFSKVADSCSGASVPPAGSCIISIVFAPTVPGGNSATLRIFSNAPTSPNFVGLAGQASVAPVAILAASPASLSFAEGVIGTTSPAQSVILTNTGGATATITSLLVSGDYAQTNTCASVPVDGSCTITVTFTPTAAGSRPGLIVVSGDASNAPLAIALSGSGTPPPEPVIELSVTSLSYGNTMIGRGSGAQAVTLRNTGGSPLTLGTITVSGEYVVNSGCPTVVPAGESCRIDVGFMPSIPGPRTGRLEVTSNASNGTQGVDLAGTGCRISILSRNPALICQ